MNYLAMELQAGELAPILLGNSEYARTISKRLFNRYGLVSHVFCDRTPFWGRFSLSAKYHPIAGFETDELLLIALKDFTAGVKNRDLILYLVPGTDSLARFIRRNREQLEQDFVLADAASLSELLG